ncbi:uncharacterized protein LOC111704714 [Eurytemora carolleeae]|uniref:uncharacterized protein LOC111704714 n=1 Tax=Eurytemora carolleeae TaxID=1294199 RepID=UPI000C768359|nr:uncharacterized protein LOC111704714 [Eurytemora carolleeae]|eukprot:XP_023332806.1 uncharacterized protein LOC111704714 [Eurytemora affinis]
MIKKRKLPSKLKTVGLKFPQIKPGTRMQTDMIDSHPPHILSPADMTNRNMSDSHSPHIQSHADMTNCNMSDSHPSHIQSPADMTNRNMSDSHPPHIQSPADMTNCNMSDSHPPHIQSPADMTNCNMSDSHPPHILSPADMTNCNMSDSHPPHIQNSKKTINQSQQYQPEPQPQYSNPKSVKKRGHGFCGMCNKYYYHLWRHFENKHRAEPSISNLMSLQILNKPEFDVQWKMMKSEMLQKKGLLPKSVSICDCGRTVRNLYQHIIRLHCPKNSGVSNIRMKVHELKHKMDFSWHPSNFKEMACFLKKDRVYKAGARDVVLVQFISKALLNRVDQDEYETIKTCFRSISKILCALGDVVEKPVTMEEVLKVKPYYQILVDLASGKIQTDILDSTTLSVRMSKTLKTMARQVLNHLKETSGDRQKIDDVLEFDKHRRAFWNQDVGKKLAFTKKRSKFNKPLNIPSKSLLGVNEREESEADLDEDVEENEHDKDDEDDEEDEDDKDDEEDKEDEEEPQISQRRR